MDAHTLALLDFPRIRELVASYASSTLGQELARQLEPRSDLAWVRREQALVTEMVAALNEGWSPPLAGLRDVRLWVRRAAIGALLTPEQLLEVADVLACTGQVYRYRMRLPAHFPHLLDLLAPVEDLGAAAKTIQGCLDPRGQVLDLASAELAEVRRQLALIEARIQAQLRRLLRDPELRKALRYPNATVCGEHYVLPVAVNYRHQVPGVVHRTSSTGETLFVEPASIACLSAERAVLKGQEARAVQRVLRRLSSDVGRLARPLTQALEVMARLDLITAKARYSRDYHLQAPAVNAAGRLWLRQARHPLLEYWYRQQRAAGVAGEKEQKSPVNSEKRRRTDAPAPPSDLSSAAPAVVPIDVHLGDAFRILLITGPNTGGKTVTLKTVGLMALMAQAGLHIPAAAGSTLPLFEDVLADIGDEQSMEQSLSTFSAHMTRIADILQRASPRSLVLLDELGAGTDPSEGAALGRALLDELDERGCLALVTTHLDDLKKYPLHNPRAENAAVEFDPQTLRPTYRLHLGQSGQSHALEVARRLPLPPAVLQRAARYLHHRQLPLLEQVQALRQEAEKARQQAWQAQQEAEQQRAFYEQQAAQWRQQAAAAAALQAARERLQPGDRVQVLRFGQEGRVVRIDPRRRRLLVSFGLGYWEVDLEEVVPLSADSPPAP